jgi:hypothetical protein
MPERRSQTQGFVRSRPSPSPEDTVSLVIETGVERDPLDPRLKLRILLHSLGGVDRRFVVQNLKFGNLPSDTNRSMRDGVSSVNSSSRTGVVPLSAVLC